MIQEDSLKAMQRQPLTRSQSEKLLPTLFVTINSSQRMLCVSDIVLVNINIRLYWTLFNKQQSKYQGAHVCGFAGKNTQKLGRITGKWIIFRFPI